MSEIVVIIIMALSIFGKGHGEYRYFCNDNSTHAVCTAEQDSDKCYHDQVLGYRTCKSICDGRDSESDHLAFMTCKSKCDTYFNRYCSLRTSLGTTGMVIPMFTTPWTSTPYTSSVAPMTDNGGLIAGVVIAVVAAIIIIIILVVCWVIRKNREVNRYDTCQKPEELQSLVIGPSEATAPSAPPDCSLPDPRHQPASHTPTEQLAPQPPTPQPASQTLTEQLASQTLGLTEQLAPQPPTPQPASQTLTEQLASQTLGLTEQLAPQPPTPQLARQTLAVQPVPRTLNEHPAPLPLHLQATPDSEQEQQPPINQPAHEEHQADGIVQEAMQGANLNVNLFSEESHVQHFMANALEPDQVIPAMQSD